MFIFSRDLIKTLDLQMTNFFGRFGIRTKYGAVAESTATSIVILSSIYLAWAYTNRALKRKAKPHALTRSMSIGVLHGGKLALQKLIDYHRVRASSEAVDKAMRDLKSLAENEHPDLWELQSNVGIMEMSSKEGEAVEILERAVKNAFKAGKQHEAYEFDMAIVELLIYKGDYGKAISRRCLTHEEISDARRPLYKAIIHLLLDQHKDEAEKEWQSFQEIRRQLQIPPDLEDETPTYKVVTGFGEFEKIVKQLKRDIEEAQTKV